MRLRRVAEEIAKILNEESYGRFIPLTTRRLKYSIIPQNLIRGYRAYIFPNPGPNILFLILYVSFEEASVLRKFVGGLKYVPYNVAYQKVLGKNELFIHLVIPAYEYADLYKAMSILGIMGYIKDMHLLIGDLINATWDNVEIYHAYKDGAWNFSYGVALKMLEDILHMKR